MKQRRGLGGSPNYSLSPHNDYNSNTRYYGGKSYGVSRRGVRGNFIPPIRSNGNNTGMTARNGGKGDDALEDSTKKWYYYFAYVLLNLYWELVSCKLLLHN